MKKVEKNVLVLHSAEQMFELVDRVEDYPKFLPWYSKTEIIERNGNELKARLFMDYMRVQQSFATHNHNIPGKEIRMDLLEGPLKLCAGLGSLSIWAVICAKSNSNWNTIFPARSCRR